MKKNNESMIYDPQEDSLLLLKHIREYAKGSVLDMGTGSGILAFEAAKYADSVLAADINRDAVKKLKQAIKAKAAKNIMAVYSDLFSKIRKTQKFGLIIFNPPYLPEDKNNPDLALDGGKFGYETIARFLEQASRHLTKAGVILLLFSSLSKKQKIDKKIDILRYKRRLVDSQKLFFEELYIYEIRKTE